MRKRIKTKVEKTETLFFNRALDVDRFWRLVKGESASLMDNIMMPPFFFTYDGTLIFVAG
jgi:hypothetical protein